MTTTIRFARSLRLTLTTAAAVALFNGTTVRASDPVPAPKQQHPIALVGGTIHPVSGPVFANGTVLFDKGVFTAIGTTVAIPANAERIDIRGKHVYPSLIDVLTTIGLVEIESVRGTVDLAETGTINPNARVETAVNPESELIPVARSAGVAIAITAPVGGLISGSSAALMMDGWTPQQMTLRAPVSLIVDWPDMVYHPGRFMRMPKEEWQKQRDAQLAALNDAFNAARHYRDAKAAERENGVPYHDTDVRWDAMVPAIEGHTPVWIRAEELSQIQSAVAWAEQQHLRIAIVTRHDAVYARDILKAKDIPVILTGTLASPSRRDESYDDVYATPATLHNAGVRFCIAGDGTASNLRWLPHHAITAAAFGLAPEEALKAVTLDAARIAGIADRVGSLEVGKDATLLISTGDILEYSTNVEQVFIQGRKADMRDKHKQMYEKYEQKYKQAKEEQTGR